MTYHQTPSPEITNLLDTEEACNRHLKALLREKAKRKGNPEEYDPLDKAANVAAWETMQIRNRVDSLYDQGKITYRP
jgi:hypothetical protein